MGRMVLCLLGESTGVEAENTEGAKSHISQKKLEGLHLAYQMKDVQVVGTTEEVGE